MRFILVFIGGGVGSLVRFLFSRYVVVVGAFPLATFLANTISSFVLGFVLALVAQKSPSGENMRLLLAIGFCGGFSTFSTFSFETLQLLQSGDMKTALLNITASILLCLLAVWLGFAVAKLL